MFATATLALVSISIGALIGGAGVGGFFMPTALTFLAGATVHQGTATSLFTFIFTGAVGAWYFHRQGSLDWQIARPISLGAAMTGFIGAWVGAQMSAMVLSAVLAALIVSAGLYALLFAGRTAKTTVGETARRPQQADWRLLFALGAVTGFLSGLTGIGGPALSVPLMMFFGFPLLKSIGAGQVLQIVSALSGTLANIRYGNVDFSLATFITAFEIVGVLIGAYAVHRMDVVLIRKVVGVLCLLAGCAFAWRAI